MRSGDPASSTASRLREAADWMEQYRSRLGRTARPPGAYLQRSSKTKGTQDMAARSKSRTSSHHPRLRRAAADRVGSVDRARSRSPSGGARAASRSRRTVDDLRTGGHWHYTMHGPDGTDYENTTQYLEVVPRQRLVYDHGGHHDRPPLFRVTVAVHGTPGPHAAGHEHGVRHARGCRSRRAASSARPAATSTWDRLAEYLGKRIAGRKQFFITRSFDAAIDRIYEMWTDPDAALPMDAANGCDDAFPPRRIRASAAARSMR